ADLAVVSVDQETAVIVRQGTERVLELGDRVVIGFERTAVGIREKLAVGGGRIVRPVRIEIMDEEEERPPSLPADPGEGTGGAPIGRRLELGLGAVGGLRQAEVLEGP